ncbi:MAG: cache domain-containing protein [Candidatus Latescibacteria bacterium]|nr:cache domain-containing protein [Candidatus Latescibacterota bacterium]
MIPVILTLILFAVSFFSIIIPAIENIVMDRKREMIHELTNSAWNVLAQLENKVIPGKYTRKDAQEDAVSILKQMRYGKDDKDYFWITDSWPTFVMHPYRNDIIGVALDDISDSNIASVLSQINEVVEYKSEGFLDYEWQWMDNPLNVVPKTSFVKKFDPWDWTIGTGVYIDDVLVEVNQIKRKFKIIAFIISFFISCLLLIILLQHNSEELKRISAEKALQDSEEKFRSIVEQSAEGFSLCDEEGKIIEWNKRAEINTGLKKSEVLGRYAWDVHDDIFCEEDSKEILSTRLLIEKILKSGKIDDTTKIQEHMLNDDDGTSKIIQELIFPIKTLKGFLMCCISRDITNIKLAEENALRQQKQLIRADKMASLSILVSGVAHEINNPNHFIMGNIGLLENIFNSIKPILHKYYEENGDFRVAGLNYSEIYHDIPEMFSETLAGSQRIKHIVQELRDFARQQPDDLIESVDFNAVVKSASTLVSNMIKKSSDNYSVKYGTNLPIIQGNFQRLEHVIINLLQNACQALPNSSKGIFLTTSYNKKTDCIVCKLKDEGIGMDENVLKHITDPFFTTKRESGNTGLGLSISSNIINEHNGKLHFVSSPGIGTTVTITFPVKNKITS